MNSEILFDDILKDERHLKAVWFKFGKKKVWIPKSQIINEKLYKNTITIPDWLVKANHLEMFRL